MASGESEVYTVNEGKCHLHNKHLIYPVIAFRCCFVLVCTYVVVMFLSYHCLFLEGKNSSLFAQEGC